MKARKKSIVIDYYEISDEDMWNSNNIASFAESFGDSVDENFQFENGRIGIKTLEGISYYINSEDVLIRRVKGEYYPCKKDIFKITYEKVE
jgi:hypothetical protein